MLQRAAVGRDEVLALDADQRLGRRRRGEAEEKQESEQETHERHYTCQPSAGRGL